jgi:hypothetical protein
MEKQTRLLQVHEAEAQTAEDVRYRRNSRKDLLMLSFSRFDPYQKRASNRTPQILLRS